MKFKLSLFSLLLFFLSVIILVPVTYASTFSNLENNKSTDTGIQTENDSNLFIQLKHEAQILDSNMDEVGVIHQNEIVSVKKINDGLYEIQGTFQIGTQTDAFLYLKNPDFTEIGDAGTNSIDGAEEVQQSISFDQGVTLSSISQNGTPSLSIYPSITFSSYYQVQDQIMVQWNNRFYYASPLNREQNERFLEIQGEINGVESPAQTDLNVNSTKGIQKTENAITDALKTENAIKATFKDSDKYFEVTENQVTVYDNSGGVLKPVGYLTKGQVYPRVSDFGDWHQIQFGNGFGYVWKDATKPVTTVTIKNENKGLAPSNRSFTANSQLTVYDNTSGSLVPFAVINKGEKYPIIGTLGEWLQVVVSGRVGYVYAPAVKLDFTANDKYFQVLADVVTIYDNSSGALRPVGYLSKGQVYPRVSDFGDWHQIQFGNGFGYIWKDATSPASGNSIQNKNMGLLNSGQTFTALNNLSIYDNTSGSLVPFAVINQGEKYPIIAQVGEWLQVDLAGRIGYAYAPAVKLGFSPSDRYFQVLEDNVTVYDNSSGTLQPVGRLTKGQVYMRVSDYGDWHQIQIGNRYGFIWKDATGVVVNPYIPNKNQSSVKFGKIAFTTLDNVTVYDSSSGSLTPFASINKGQTYRAISHFGSDWLKIDFAGRIGYVYKPATEVTYISRTIFLDAGHGGSDPGAAAGGYLEKNINFAVTQKVRSILVNRGYNVMMTRENDTYIGLYDRAGMANQADADVFVSIHTNSAGSGSSVNGIETYYYKYDPAYPSKINSAMHNDPERVSKSISLAKIIQNKLVSYTGATNRGSDGASFAVIRETKMPSILVELGFITNSTERQNLVSESYQNKLAQAIADGIIEYLNYY
ncbi:N-acetylmuramoyl-L-alanine amidase [Caldibacillus thermoamylovorans]|uniref:N-acetylmuramoyl-L-alanine amidase n=1 Tax=Caldibacillus thermoamylovorans TaxID=35841 RepID=UPI00204162EE|nr:N-acetylmuramoyl-L-alanine amidase [Caldibacillus thermoamylovorans]MCM3797737.1 N-acetylmuramoyl-L-alanine amidase [Caldibacillus thermoamylovorans]